MPATPYAKLLVSLNSGATQSGGITGANSDTVALTAESTVGWNLDTPPKWEIYSYPDGWTGPASGWTTESVAQPFGGTADIYVYYGLGPPPTFTLPALPLWGKFLFRLTVQGGVLNGIISPALTDDTTAVQIASPNGLFDTATLETTQFSQDRAWSGPLQENWRIIDDALGNQLTWELASNATQPSVGATVALTFLDADTMQVGQVIASSAGIYEVTNIGAAPIITVELIQALAIAPAGTVLDGTLFGLAGLSLRSVFRGATTTLKGAVLQ